MDDSLSDDYVASLLAKDARFLSSGLRRPSSAGPPKRKPNTRFLRNILRDTDAHNAALLAKEEEESRARLAALDPRRKQRAERQVWDVRARREGRSGEARSEGRLSRTGGDGTRDRGEQDRRRSSKDERHRRRSRSREGREDGRRERHRHRPRSRSPAKVRHRSRSRSPHRSKRDSEPQHARRSRSRSPRRRRSPSSSEDSYGPRRPARSPPVRSRGRGATSGSGMDRRFDSSYDPRDDVQPDANEADDWDMALEAARDRAAWRKSGADRLRAAGFTEDEIATWAKGGRDESDVRWAKAGESREWDRGKKLDDL